MALGFKKDFLTPWGEDKEGYNGLSIQIPTSFIPQLPPKRALLATIAEYNLVQQYLLRFVWRLDLQVCWGTGG